MLISKIFTLCCLNFVLPVNTQRVDIIPLHIVAVLRGEAIFVCYSRSTIRSVEWLIQPPGLTVQQSFSLGVGSVAFGNITESHNGTMLQCEASMSSGDTLTSGTATLLVQGLLSAPANVLIDVVSHYRSVISLTWTAPFSLDLTNVDPDITYCVDVVDSTSMSTLHSQCDLVNTEFNYTVSGDDDYIFTVTPVNPIGNGTSVSISYSRVGDTTRVGDISDTTPVGDISDTTPVGNSSGSQSQHGTITAVFVAMLLTLLCTAALCHT